MAVTRPDDNNCVFECCETFLIIACCFVAIFSSAGAGYGKTALDGVENVS